MHFFWCLEFISQDLFFSICHRYGLWIGSPLDPNFQKYETNADALSTLKKWSISRSLLSTSYVFSSYFLLQILGCLKSILTIWGKDSMHIIITFNSLWSSIFWFCWLLIFLAIFTEELLWMFYIYFFNSWCRRELLHSYGFEHMATLNNLEKAGLFKKQVWYHFAFII